MELAEQMELTGLVFCGRAKVVLGGCEGSSRRIKMQLTGSRRAAGYIINRAGESIMEIPDRSYLGEKPMRIHLSACRALKGSRRLSPAPW